MKLKGQYAQDPRKSYLFYFDSFQGNETIIKFGIKGKSKDHHAQAIKHATQGFTLA